MGKFKIGQLIESSAHPGNITLDKIITDIKEEIYICKNVVNGAQLYLPFSFVDNRYTLHKSCQIEEEVKDLLK